MKLAEIIALLADAGVASPDWDARMLAAHVLGVGHMSVRPGTEVPGEVLALARRRAAREPLQHILGTAPFGPLDLAVGPGVFIPRPETEVLADWGARQVASTSSPVVVDLCAGSGALGLYVATQRRDADVTLVEKSAEALTWLRRNVETFAPRASIVQADVTDPAILPELHGRVDLLLTNPPYVPETGGLEPEVYADPHDAVFAGADGMSVIDRMTSTLAALLADGGLLGVEHDETTAEAVAAVLAGHGGFAEIATMPDLTGRPRFTTAVRRASV
ncbi:peptide chain release factor N(5)-glutamine methyltransferase [Corynebacterium guangdongense]|uniref:Release factor glutamine methyltransferase n=1 Tax=Corynebacterium guangdongense TaxID=1783348 RepID=A0ABU1ZW72_9CORY|nr:peptide chain release factor N(5)-glutamine methyltransferase [Corynebacterium guangdongense]MDR7329110.1 release factor glutamine methyltransferase [Corynebacterium guangdongense]WJZ17679.1 Release factor glutamine methyltransferase [Corynebacterium guangdongense]